MKVVDIGMPETARKAVSKGLAKLLADTYTLYLKTQNFHWNVTGPHFHSLHLLFEEQYKQLAEANDTIAERIRALGYAAPATFAEFATLRTLQETSGTPGANEMLKLLLVDNEAVSRAARAVFEVAQEGRDEVSADLMIERMGAHEKAAWMLRSHLEA